MATTDSNGILFYEDTDAVSPLHTLLNTGQQSVSNAVTELKVAGSAGASTQTPTTSVWTRVTLASDSNLVGGVTRVASGLTVPETGVYAVSCNAYWPPSLTGRRGIGGGKNSTVFSALDCTLVAPTNAGSFTTTAPTVLKDCVAGDIINLYAYQDSGSALNSARID